MKKTSKKSEKADKLPKTEEEWKKKLPPKQYQILRGKGTEAPFTGSWLGNREEGTYICMGCGSKLFTSKDKFDSGTGWPSFSKPATKTGVKLVKDTSMGMGRTEVLCKKCGGHLGHVFDDGPAPTGKRFCINSAALDFEEKE